MLLLLAIAAEVIGTSCLKLSDGFSRLWPSVVVLLAYSTSMLLLSQVVKTIPLGITYAMWSCLLYTSPSPRDYAASRMPSSA